MKEAQEESPALYYNIVEELNDFTDWSISESNYWGIPIPHFIYKNTGEPLMNEEIVPHVVGLFDQHGGSDAWYKLSVYELLPPDFKEQADLVEKGYEVFESWFDSSFSWHHSLEQNS
jgi:isoleucyl-tRNA synthetase